MNLFKYISFVLVFTFAFAACNNPEPQSPKPTPTPVLVKVPDFNADSAFSFVKAQTDFGPRVPGTQAHSACATYFNQYFLRLGFEVNMQPFKARNYKGKILDGVNVIASFNPTQQKRILLCSHWDSRPFADHDPDVKNYYKPIDGANDGASGVGVLMEVARQLQMQSPSVGIDIVLFDLEDYGQHDKEASMPQSEMSWALGSQYWGANPHLPGYRAQYGILLDMVGAKDAKFAHEYYSMQFAPAIVAKVWKAAQNAGYSNYFVDEEGGGVLDDHVFVNRLAHIPTIDIIQFDKTTQSKFYTHWHTVEDNIQNIDPQTLKAVGQTVLEVIYRE